MSLEQSLFGPDFLASKEEMTFLLLSEDLVLPIIGG
jgi:hypothetical protein